MSFSSQDYCTYCWSRNHASWGHEQVKFKPHFSQIRYTVKPALNVTWA